MDIVVFALSALALALALVALAVPLAQRIGLPLPVAIASAGLVAGTTAALGRVAEGLDEERRTVRFGWRAQRVDATL